MLMILEAHRKSGQENEQIETTYVELQNPEKLWAAWRYTAALI